jgi:hypothetical protein
MLDLASTMSTLPAGQGEAPWPLHEYVRGWGVFALPFDSGHVLALRVFPQNDFGGYCTLWHRDPLGRWSIYVDGSRLDTACPRYYGPACHYTGYAEIDLTWTGPTSLRVGMSAPSLEWTLTATSTRSLTLLNAISARLPASSWRSARLTRLRERVAHALGMGDLELSGVMPSGHTGLLMPEQMYFVAQSRALFGGLDLGEPTTMRPNPTIGGVPLPARGVVAKGGAVWQILDPQEYVRTRRETNVHIA